MSGINIYKNIHGFPELIKYYHCIDSVQTKIGNATEKCFQLNIIISL